MSGFDGSWNNHQTEEMKRMDNDTKEMGSFEHEPATDAVGGGVVANHNAAVGTETPDEPRFTKGETAKIKSTFVAGPYGGQEVVVMNTKADNRYDVETRNGNVWLPDFSGDFLEKV